jgi:hypothetical protein
MSSSTDAFGAKIFWCEDDEPVPRRSKLNFGQDEVLAGLRLCNLRQVLNFKSLDQVLDCAEATHHTGAPFHKVHRGVAPGGVPITSPLAVMNCLAGESAARQLARR